MSERDEPGLGDADTVAGDDPAAEAAEADTMVGAQTPERSPSRQHLHDAVKGALFGGSAPRSLKMDTGTVFAGRYRIEQVLGRGGMGEVFRAHDLVLDETVALKLLPTSLAGRPGYYERFVQEVRLARQVSHPAVCRVHDLGEVEGQPFISMEYVDGEDLASLLRRIGRLGAEKAIELSHQLCAGLAALHERGIIHRDLKPSNLMLDGRGQIRIADFGLASVAAELREHEIRDGTPAYQAPEQRDGREATVRSDLYAVGLILREMFTGLGPGGADRVSSTTTSESALDPGVSEVIQLCLSPDPTSRPESALAVSAALPGGDPLAAALAAGRLPSPEAVANARTVGQLSILASRILVGIVMVGLLVLAVLHDQRSVLAADDHALSPPVLEHHAVEILERMGLEAGFPDTVFLEWDYGYLDEIDDAEEAAERFEDFSPMRFEYRKYSLRLDGAALSSQDIPMEAEGDIRIILDDRGRLLQLHRVPTLEPDDDPDQDLGQDPDQDASVAAATDPAPLGWEGLLQFAGLDAAAVTEIPTTWRPPVFADTLRTARASFGDVPIEIHCATLKGAAVWFDIRRLEQEAARPTQLNGFAGLAFLVIVAVALVVLVVILRNAVATLRRREGDFRGARMVALLAFASDVVMFLLDVRGPELILIVFWLIVYAGQAVLVWLTYLMVEPYARANWPRSLVSWNRLLQGRWRDPMVGRDLLVGVAAGVLGAAVLYLAQPVATFGTPRSLLGVRHALGMVFNSLSSALLMTFLFYIVMLGLHRVFRLRAIAVAIFLGFVPSLSLLLGASALTVLASVLVGAACVVLMFRYGLLAMAFSALAAMTCLSFPITLDLSAWYATMGLGGALGLGATALGGAWISSRPERRRG